PPRLSEGKLGSLLQVCRPRRQRGRLRYPARFCRARPVRPAGSACAVVPGRVMFGALSKLVDRSLEYVAGHPGNLSPTLHPRRRADMVLILETRLVSSRKMG